MQMYYFKSQSKSNIIAAILYCILISGANCNPKEPIYVGCYLDDVDRDFKEGPDSPWPLNTDRFNKETCNEACKEYKYLALMGKRTHAPTGECRCGDAYATADKYVKKPDAECGNTNGDYIGAYWRNAVFEVCQGYHINEYD